MNVDEKLTATTKARYDRHARTYDQGMAKMDKYFLGKRRGLLWSFVRGGRILEVGVGTGANFPYYPKDADVTAIDLSEKMLDQAREKALRDGVKVDLREMDIQQLAFPDGYFDYVVSTCVFCSVPDPILGLKELARVCKPDGKVVMLEHVRSETPLGYLMDLMNPLVVRMGGANINRRTVENVRMAGFSVERVDSFVFNIVKLIVARPSKKS